MSILSKLSVLPCILLDDLALSCIARYLGVIACHLKVGNFSSHTVPSGSITLYGYKSTLGQLQIT